MRRQPIGDGEEAATAAGELAGVNRRVGRTLVLAGLDLRVGEGELYGLIGPDGAARPPPCGSPWDCSVPTPARCRCWGATLLAGQGTIPMARATLVVALAFVAALGGCLACTPAARSATEPG